MPQHEASDDLIDRYSSLRAEQAGSGLSVAELAREVGLSAATLCNWRRRLQATSDTPQLVEISLSKPCRSSSPTPDISVINDPTRYRPAAAKKSIVGTPSSTIRAE